MTIIKCSNCINYHSDSFDLCPSCGFQRSNIITKNENPIKFDKKNKNKLGKLVSKFFRTKKKFKN